MKLRTRLAPIAAALLMWASATPAMTYLMPTDKALLDSADGVLVGTVSGVPVAAKGGRLPRIEYRVMVERVLAGRFPHAEARLAMPGSVPGADRIVHIPGVPKLQPGQRVLVFFDRAGTQVIAPEELSLGLFLESRAKDGSVAYARALDGATDIHPKRENERYGLARDAGKFERWIRATSAKRTAETDYFLEPAASAKFVLALAQGDNLPYRWFDFDTNTTVNWVAVAGGMANTPAINEFTAASAALAGWTSDPGSRILLSYAGTVASDDGNDFCNGNSIQCPDLANAFIWDDTGNDIGGTYPCGGSGTLAIGGAIFTGNTQLSNGAPYHRNLEAYVITRAGAGCAFNTNQLDATEILTHEVGHTLGLAHSNVPTANMNAFVHRDGRGSNIQADDRAGAAFIYPQPGGGGPVGRIHFDSFE